MQTIYTRPTLRQRAAALLRSAWRFAKAAMVEIEILSASSRVDRLREDYADTPAQFNEAKARLDALLEKTRDSKRHAL